MRAERRQEAARRRGAGARGDGERAAAGTVSRSAPVCAHVRAVRCEPGDQLIGARPAAPMP